MAEKTTTHESKTDEVRKGDGKASHITAKNVTSEEAAFLGKHSGELSGTTLRARWVHSTEEREDHPGETLATQSHDVIKRWAEKRGARPCTVESSEHAGQPGVLRFNFPGYGGDRLREISWDDWFAPFDERQLVFLFQEHKSDGSQSNFFHLDNPEREHD